MGYLISGHFMLERPNPERVRAALPSSVGFGIYRHESVAVFAIDTFRASKPSHYPLSTATPGTDLPLQLPPDLQAVNDLYEELRKKGTANGLKRSYISLSRMLSAALAQPLLSAFSDDEGSDFACVSRSGTTARVVARCGDDLVLFDNGRLSITKPEAKRTLHAVLSKEFELFTGKPATALGLGTFDPPDVFGFVPVEDVE